MSKLQLSAALVLVALFGLPVTAQAATSFAPASTGVSIHTEDDEFEDEGEDGEEYEGEDSSSFADEEEAIADEDDESFVVPPAVIHPHGPGHNDDDPMDQIMPESYSSGPITDKSGGQPIRVDQVLATAKTPTDLFVDTAVVGLGAVGAGALALGTMVGVRAVRARRNGEKADYFYGE